MMARSSSASLVQARQGRMTETVKNSLFTPQIHIWLTWTLRATYIKGDPYIRDMKHTRFIIHMHYFTSFLGVFANFCQLPL
jgi:hypothetical protein